MRDAERFPFSAIPETKNRLPAVFRARRNVCSRMGIRRELGLAMNEALGARLVLGVADLDVQWMEVNRMTAPILPVGMSASGRLGLSRWRTDYLRKITKREASAHVDVSPAGVMTLSRGQGRPIFSN